MSTFERKRKYILVFLSASLCSTVVFKVADIQYLELIFFLDLLVLLGLIFRQGLQVRVYRPFSAIGKNYAIFLGVAFLFSLFALQQDFASSFHDSALKKPVLVTIARMAELFLDVFYMLYLASLYLEDEALCRFGMKTYYWVGMVGCAYAFATFPLNVLFNAQLGTYGDAHRFRGFNNEGSGFGLYLLSVVVVAVVLYRRKWLGRRQFMWAMAIFLVGLVGSQSKALFFAAALLGVIDMMWLFRGWRRWSLIGGMLVALIAVASLLDFQTQIDAYIRGSEKYQELSNLRPTDGNFVMGRVAGAVLGPRMLAAHPLLGIGWGNYPLVRDDPEYRQGTAFALSSTDAPNLGLLDYVIELGIPLWLYLTWVELKPALMVRRRSRDVWLLSLALMQPLSNWAGAHLNLTHPWVVSGFALGLAYQTWGVDAPVPEAKFS
jgi:hypothetical protein